MLSARNCTFIWRVRSRLRNVHNRNVHNYEDWKRSCHQIVGFIIAVLTDLCEKNLLQKLFDQKDAQGRTILQIFVLCQYVREYSGILAFTFREMLEILPDACVNTLDKAGRTVLHWAVAHDITWAVEELLESGKARPDDTSRPHIFGILPRSI
jgi:ankyrin repeat protein